MRNSVPSQNRSKESPHRRLVFHTVIGMFMLAVAGAGYLFLGPASETATGGHVRPADVATSVSERAPGVTTISTGSHVITDADLVIMQAEMSVLSAEVDALLEQAEPQATLSADAPLSTNNPLPLRVGGGE